MKTIEVSGRSKFPDNFTDHALELVATDMVNRGNNFLAAGIMLKRADGHEYVWRHNFCQGIEILLKGLLLRRNFRHYWPKLKIYGHKLLPLADDAAKAFGMRPPSGQVRSELSNLAQFYQNHWLRYSSGAAILIDARTLE